MCGQGCFVLVVFLCSESGQHEFVLGVPAGFMRPAAHQSDTVLSFGFTASLITELFAAYAGGELHVVPWPHSVKFIKRIGFNVEHKELETLMSSVGKSSSDVHPIPRTPSCRKKILSRFPSSVLSSLRALLQPRSRCILRSTTIFRQTNSSPHPMT